MAMTRGQRVKKEESERRVLLSITGPYRPSAKEVYYQWIMQSEELGYTIHGDFKHKTKAEALQDANLRAEFLRLHVARVVGA